MTKVKSEGVISANSGEVMSNFTLEIELGTASFPALSRPVRCIVKRPPSVSFSTKVESSSRGSPEANPSLGILMLIFILICGLSAVIYGAWTSKSIIAMSTGNKKMKEISMAIQEGAKAYLNRAISRQMIRDVDGACDDWEKARLLGIKVAEKYLINDCK